MRDFLWLVCYGHWHCGFRRVPPVIGFGTDYYDGPIWWANIGPFAVYATP